MWTVTVEVHEPEYMMTDRVARSEDFAQALQMASEAAESDVRSQTAYQGPEAADHYINLINHAKDTVQPIATRGGAWVESEATRVRVQVRYSHR